MSITTTNRRELMTKTQSRLMSSIESQAELAIEKIVKTPTQSMSCSLFTHHLDGNWTKDSQVKVDNVYPEKSVQEVKDHLKKIKDDARQLIEYSLSIME